MPEESASPIFRQNGEMTKVYVAITSQQVTEIADCLTFLWRLFAKFLGSTSLKLKWLTISDGDVKMTFNLQYEKVPSIEFFKCLK